MLDINKGHYLELMDRLNMVACMLNDYCLSHPLSESNNDIEKQIEKSIEEVLNAYKLVGEKEDEKDIW